MTTASVSATDTAIQVEEPDNLYALSACLMDAATGRVLFEKEGEKERAMASTTKIMTLVLALEKGELSDEVTISENAAKQPDVQLNVNTGETYRLEDLLYSLMLESHNDTAVAIAEHIGGSVEGFVAMMNEKAKELSLSQTHFVTPNGLDGEDEGGKHRTTAVELAKILSYCITASPKKEEFLKITQTASYTFSDTTGKRTFTCENHNAFLNMMEGAITGKTGFTGEAGYCYVGAVEWEGKTFVAALLGCGWPNNKGYKWKDMKKLIEYGLENYELQSLEELPRAGEILKTTPVEQGAGISYGQVADTTLILKGQEDGLISQREELLLRTDERVTVEVTVPDSLAAPVQEGEVVGKVCYFINGIQVEEGEVLVGSTVEKIDFFWCFSQLFDLFGL
jgi:D-alanyl-D-alanine carboxypeptidase (penicillin-binding protein 5/6)